MISQDTFFTLPFGVLTYIVFLHHALVYRLVSFLQARRWVSACSPRHCANKVNSNVDVYGIQFKVTRIVLCSCFEVFEVSSRADPINVVFNKRRTSAQRSSSAICVFVKSFHLSTVRFLTNNLQKLNQRLNQIATSTGHDTVFSSYWMVIFLQYSCSRRMWCLQLQFDPQVSTKFLNLQTAICISAKSIDTFKIQTKTLAQYISLMISSCAQNLCVCSLHLKWYVTPALPTVVITSLIR